MKRNLGAVTLLGKDYPDFVSINQDGEDVEVVVRQDNVCKSVTMPTVVFGSMMDNINKHFVKAS